MSETESFSDTAGESDSSPGYTPVTTVPIPMMPYGIPPGGIGSAFPMMGSAGVHASAAPVRPAYGEATQPFGMPSSYPMYVMPPSAGQPYTLFPQFSQAPGSGISNVQAPMAQMPVPGAPPPQYLPYQYFMPPMGPPTSVSGGGMIAPAVAAQAVTTPSNPGVVMSPHVGSGARPKVPANSRSRSGKISGTSGRPGVETGSVIGPPGGETGSSMGSVTPGVATVGETGKREGKRPVAAAIASPVKPQPVSTGSKAGTGKARAATGTLRTSGGGSWEFPENPPPRIEGGPSFSFGQVPVGGGAPGSPILVPAGLEAEQEDEFEMDGSPTAHASASGNSGGTPGGKSKRKRSVEKRKRERANRKKRSAAQGPETLRFCPACVPETKGFKGYGSSTFPRHVANCQMYQFYLCPLPNCCFYCKRSDQLREHLISTVHGGARFNFHAAPTLVERCRRTVGTEEGAQEIRIEPARAELRSSCSLPMILQWLEDNAHRTPFCEVLRWPGVTDYLADRAMEFTLDTSSVWATPPVPLPRAIVPAASGSSQVLGPVLPQKQGPESPAEPMELGGEEARDGAAGEVEVEASPSSSTGAVEVFAPPPKRLRPEPDEESPLPGISRNELGMARDATLVLHQGGSLRPEFRAILHRVAAAVGGSAWLDNRRQYLRTNEALGKRVPLEAFRAMARPLTDCEKDPIFQGIPAKEEGGFKTVLSPTASSIRPKIERLLAAFPTGHGAMIDRVRGWMKRAGCTVDFRTIIRQVREYREEHILGKPPARPPPPARSSRSTSRHRGKDAKSGGRKPSPSPSPHTRPAPRPPTLGDHLIGSSGLSVAPTVLVRPPSSYSEAVSQTAVDLEGDGSNQPTSTTGGPAKPRGDGTSAARPHVPAQGQRRSVLEEAQTHTTFDRVVSGNVSGGGFASRDVRLQNTPARVSQAISGGFPVPEIPTSLPTPSPVRLRRPRKEEWEVGPETSPQWFGNGVHPPHTLGGANVPRGAALPSTPKLTPAPSPSRPRSVNTSFTLTPTQTSPRVDTTREMAIPADFRMSYVPSSEWEGVIPAGAHLMVTFRDEGGIHNFYGDTAIPMRAIITGVTPNPREYPRPGVEANRLARTEETQTEPSMAETLAGAPVETVGQAVFVPEAGMEVVLQSGAPGSSPSSNTQLEEKMECEEKVEGSGASSPDSQATVTYVLDDTSEEDGQSGVAHERTDTGADREIGGLGPSLVEGPEPSTSGPILTDLLTHGYSPIKTVLEGGMLVLAVPATTAGSVYSTRQPETSAQPSGSRVGRTNVSSSYFAVSEDLTSTLALETSGEESGGEIMESMRSPLCSNDRPAPPLEPVVSAPELEASGPSERKDADPDDTEDHDL